MSVLSCFRADWSVIWSLHNRNQRGRGNRHQNGVMRNRGKSALMVLLCGLALCVARAQEGVRAADALAGSGHAAAKTASDGASRPERGRKSARVMSSDDRLAVIASALDSKTPRYAERDCSHLVHAIYERAGFPYAYASSDDLYDGVEGFQRVSQPQTGDLVVWRGHAGIVIRPSRHVFFSFLRAGPGTDDYRSRYWSGRGQPRFYRYIKDDGCAGCALAHSRASR